MENDPDVLSNDKDIHIEKVRKGGYAFISELTFNAAYVEKNCSLVAAFTVRDIRYMFAIGVQTGSPIGQYTKDL